MSTARFDKRNHLTSIWTAIKLSNRFFLIPQRWIYRICEPEQKREGVIVGVYLSAMRGVLQLYGRDYRNT